MSAAPIWKARNLRLFLLAALVSNIGNWMQIFTEQWLTLNLAGGEAARWGGRLAFSSGLATLVFIPLGGWIADHLDRPKAMALAQLWLMALAVSMALLALRGWLGLHGLVFFALASGLGGALAMTLGHSLVADLAGPEQAPAAMGLMGAQFNLSRILGPTVAALLFPVFGAAGNFALNALTFLPLVWVSRHLSVRSSRVESGETRTYREGWAVLRTHTGLRTIVLLGAVAGLFAWGYFALLPVYGAHQLGLGERGVAGLLSAFGIGAVLGGLRVARDRKGGDPLRRIIRAFGLFGVGLILLGALPHRFLAPVVFAAMGFVQATFVSTMSGMVMAWSPPALRGRLNAIYLIAIIGITPLGNLAAGEIAQALGPSGARWVLGGQGCILVVAALLAFTAWRREPSVHPPA